MRVKGLNRNQKRRKEYVHQSWLLLNGLDGSKIKRDGCKGTQAWVSHFYVNLFDKNIYRISLWTWAPWYGTESWWFRLSLYRFLITAGLSKWIQVAGSWFLFRRKIAAVRHSLDGGRPGAKGRWHPFQKGYRKRYQANLQEIGGDPMTVDHPGEN